MIKAFHFIFVQILNCINLCVSIFVFEERKKVTDLTQPSDKSPYTHKKIQKQRDNTKTPAKTSITQRLRTDEGRSVGPELE